MKNADIAYNDSCISVVRKTEPKYGRYGLTERVSWHGYVNGELQAVCSLRKDAIEVCQLYIDRELK